MDLKDTVKLMDGDYKDRFKAEYYQVGVRLQKLQAMLKKWDNAELDFTPTCPRSTYDLQVEYMSKYKAILEMRAAIEEVRL